MYKPKVLARNGHYMKHLLAFRAALNLKLIEILYFELSLFSEINE